MTGLTFDDAPTEDEVKYLETQLEAFNKNATQVYDFQPVQLVVRDESGEIVAGIKGVTGWQWLYISTLWVHEDHRGKGIGRDLLQRAEATALKRGCNYACLTTFSFQSPRFYERLGFVVYGVLDNYPDQHQMFFLKKRIFA